MDDFGSSSMGRDDEASALPGFRFHPTDQELVGFYLRRKVEKKPMVMELIKQIDIYKYDPWDLPKSTVGDGEWYFFCRRGRKYKNSIRPNRVTGSGFWKATGIDKPVYSTGSADHDNCCIGLKKSLVYYRGNAGKGTKTDWMMHEFRLPMKDEPTILPKTSTSAYHQEAEVWTLCRILKRNSTYKKYNYSHRPAEDRRRIWAKQSPTEACSATGSVESDEGQGCYISFQGPLISFQDDGVKVPMVGRNQQFPSKNIASSNVVPAASVGPSLFLNDEIDNVGFPHEDVDELRSLVGQRTAVPTWSPFQLY